MDYRTDNQELTAVDFLQLAQRVWPGQYDLELTTTALTRTINVTAWDDGRLVGCVRILTDGHFFSTVTEVLVDLACRRQGIGRHLMELAWGVSPTSLQFGVQPGSEGFFEKIGFEPALMSYGKRKPRPVPQDAENV